LNPLSRQKGDRYELIAGERRLRAIKTYTSEKNIQAKIIQVDDLQARRISAAENLQRQNFSAVETIEAVVEIVDAHLIENQEYATMGDRPESRVYSTGKTSFHSCQQKSSINHFGKWSDAV